MTLTLLHAHMAEFIDNWHYLSPRSPRVIHWIDVAAHNLTLRDAKAAKVGAHVVSWWKPLHGTFVLVCAVGTVLH